MKKLIIVDELTYYNLVFLFFYRVFGYKIIYLNSSFLKNKEALQIFFESFDIKCIDYTTFTNYDFELSFNLPYELSLKLHDKLIKENDYNFLNNILKVKNKKKLEIVFIDMIRKYIGNVTDLFIVADYYKTNHKVFVWHKKNFIIKNVDSNYKNLNNFLVSFFETLYVFLLKIYNLFVSKLKTKIRNTKENYKIDDDVGVKEKNTSQKVIFFPHKGLKTANSYEKNFFYSDDKKSPFYQKNIEHIEYDVVSTSEEYKEIEADYLRKKLNYRFIPKIGVGSMLSFALEFIKKVKVFYPSSKNILLLSVFISVKYYLKHLKSSKNAKIAIIGYDFLCPKSLSLALDILGIHTVAYQERYLSSFVGMGSVSIDTYFMWNDKLKKRMDRSGLSYIGEYIPVGCVKINLFDIESDEHILSMKKRYKKVVVAFDYHSAQNRFDDKRLPIANWKNNLIFYRDIIKLAVAFPDIYIIIRGKNDAWCDMEVFEDIYNIIESIDNIMVSRDFKRLNVSYQLVKDSDLVIGRYTSLMEEAMAYGIAAISCDYGCNFKGNIEKMYDGESCFEFVQSYEELKQKVKDILFEDYRADSNCVESLYKTSDDIRSKIVTLNSDIIKD